MKEERESLQRGHSRISVHPHPSLGALVRGSDLAKTSGTEEGGGGKKEKEGTRNRRDDKTTLDQTLITSQQHICFTAVS